MFSKNLILTHLPPPTPLKKRGESIWLCTYWIKCFLMMLANLINYLPNQFLLNVITFVKISLVSQRWPVFKIVHISANTGPKRLEQFVFKMLLIMANLFTFIFHLPIYVGMGYIFISTLHNVHIFNKSYIFVILHLSFIKKLTNLQS